MQLEPYTESLVFDCSSCGEKMVIYGRLEDWLPRNPIFRSNCGKGLTFSDEAKAQYYASLKAS